MNHLRVLIAGIGNIFLGDDAFGVKVAQRLRRETLPDGVAVVDFGIRGLDLTYALLDEAYESVILVDAVPRGGAPGTLYVIEPGEADLDDPAPSDPGEVLIDTHNMDPAKVLRLVGAMGGNLRRIVLVGCEPQPCDSYEEMAGGLSAPVSNALNEAVDLVLSLAAEMLRAVPEQRASLSSVSTEPERNAP